MCIFGLGCCSEELWELTIFLLCYTDYQRIHPAETEPFDMWPLQTHPYNESSQLWKLPKLMLCGQEETNLLCQNQPCPLPLQPSSYRHYLQSKCKTFMYILNIHNPPMCVKSEIAVHPLSILFAHKAFKFQTIAPLVRAYGTGRWNAVTWQTVQRLTRVGYTSEGTGCAGTSSTQNVDQTDIQHSLAYYSLIRNIFALHGLAESH